MKSLKLDSAELGTSPAQARPPKESAQVASQGRVLQLGQVKADAESRNPEVEIPAAGAQVRRLARLRQREGWGLLDLGEDPGRELVVYVEDPDVIELGPNLGYQ